MTICGKYATDLIQRSTIQRYSKIFKIKDQNPSKNTENMFIHLTDIFLV